MFLSCKPGVKWTNRGNPTSVDYQKVDFTIDGVCHLKDISAIVGKGRKLVSFFVRAQSNTVDGQIILFDPDNTGHVNITAMFVPKGQQVWQTLWVYTNAGGEIGYRITVDPAFSYVTIVVNGWLD